MPLLSMNMLEVIAMFDYHKILNVKTTTRNVYLSKTDNALDYC